MVYGVYIRCCDCRAAAEKKEGKEKKKKKRAPFEEYNIRYNNLIDIGHPDQKNITIFDYLKTSLLFTPPLFGQQDRERQREFENRFLPNRNCRREIKNTCP